MAATSPILLIVAAVCLQCRGLVTPPPPDAVPINEGDSCRPPLGYLPIACGTVTELSVTTEVLPAEQFGYTRLLLVNDTAYTYQRRCANLLDSRRNYFTQCFLDCLPVNSNDRCTSSTHMETRTRMSCCIGTAPRSSDYVIDIEKDALNIFFYPLAGARMPAGCSVADGPTLLQCLMQQRLTDFLQLVMDANLTALLNSTNQAMTLFAPVNGQVPSGLTQNQARLFVMSHLVPRTLNASQLVCGVRLVTNSSNFLHVSSVEHVHRRRALSGSHYVNTIHSAFRENLVIDVDRVINGRRILIEDACNIKNSPRRLHIVSGPIPVSSQSLLVALESFSEVSQFLQIASLMEIGLRSLLSLPRPLTVLAPTNDAFNIFSSMLLDCLLLSERNAIINLLLYHMSDSVEYMSSLVNRRFLYTKVLEFLPVMNSNGQPLLGTEMGRITTGDVVAANGVLHIIDKLLLPPGFSFGSCESLTPAPPTTPDPVVSNTTTTIAATPTSSSSINVQASSSFSINVQVSSSSSINVQASSPTPTTTPTNAEGGGRGGF